jgi:hypothetical protein
VSTFINHSNKIIFIHVPKTGGTSITKSLMEMSHWDNADFEFWDKHDAHATTTQIRKLCDFDNYFSLAVMREPFSWLSSLFRYRYHTDVFSNIIPTPHSNFELFIDEFYNINENLQSHWFTVKGKADVNKVINFSNLDAEINQQFNLNRPLKKINVGENKNFNLYKSIKVFDKAVELLDEDLKLYETLFGKRKDYDSLNK